MRRNNAPVAATGGHDTAATRFFSWLPALLLAQLVLALWAGGRALAAEGVGIGVFLLAVGNQLLFLLRSVPILFLLSWPLLALRGARLRVLTIALLWSLFLLLQAGLEQYFQVAKVLLGADLFGYSLAEIRTTVSGTASAGLGVASWIGVLLPLALLWAVLAWCARRQRIVMRAVSSLLLLLGVAAWWLPLTVGAAGLGNAAEHAVVTSKGAYFVADGVRYLRGAQATSEPVPAATATAADVLDPRYPFLHIENTPDTLGPYFKPTRDGRKPNVVVIVVEGLGRSFSGPEATLGSFTPFLDQLAARSLYFRNFMANQGRTFAVLPSLFGSAPFAKEGFAELGPDMPPHAGLFNVLRQQGYHTAFYSGTDSGFDNEHTYLQLQQVENIIDLRNFGAGYRRNPYSEWGYPDRELVARLLADTQQLRAPFVLAMQTISMHTAYQFPGQAKYQTQVLQRLETLNIPADKRAKYRAATDIYSAILYTDDQLRHYFEEVKSAPWYADTIFVITGDHRLVEIPQDTHIERYHVPLIIYSPLLKHPQSIGAVSSHMDVTPALLALLAHTYGLQRPAKTTWLGRGLDMATQFRSQHEFPLKQTKTSAEDFVSGHWFLHDGQLFELGEGIRASALDDAGVRAQVTQRLQRYQVANAALLRTHRLSAQDGRSELRSYENKSSAPLAHEAAVQALPAGLGVEDVALEQVGAEVKITATFANGDAVASHVFVPLAVLSDTEGRELGEGYGSAVRLQAHEQRKIVMALSLPTLTPGRYLISLRPSDPDSGKSVGRGRYHVGLEITGPQE